MNDKQKAYLERLALVYEQSAIRAKNDSDKLRNLSYKWLIQHILDELDFLEGEV